MKEPSSLTSAPDDPTEKLNTKAAGIIGLAVMCSRLLGLAREQIFAALFGGGGAMDAFTAAFRIPNLLRDLFAEGALSTAFVTTFSKTIARGGDAAAWRLANRVATLTAVVLGVLCIAGMVFADQLVALLAPGFEPSKAALTAQLTRIMFPFILLVSLAALIMGMLNSKSVFGMPAMASSFFNLGSIVGGVTPLLTTPARTPEPRQPPRPGAQRRSRGAITVARASATVSTLISLARRGVKAICC
jgi:putative peptidoglycan lipid II flippase